MNRILDKIHKDEIEYTEANEGIVTSTYILDDFVVQEPDHGNGGRLRKNVFICEKLSENGAPVPEVIEFSEDPLYTVFERLERFSLDERSKFSKEEYLEATRQAGNALSQIHAQHASGYGKPKRDNLEKGEYDDWYEFVQDYIQGSLNYAESERFKPIAEKASEIINVEELPERPDPRVLHMDYTPDNVIVDQDLSVGIIDFDGVKYGDPRFELMHAELIMSKRGPEIVEAFRKGYNSDLEITPELERNYKALAVLREVRGGEWCLRNEKDVNLEEWSQGLQDFLKKLEN